MIRSSGFDSPARDFQCEAQDMKIHMMHRKHPKFGTFRGRLGMSRDAVEHTAHMRNLERFVQEHRILNPPKKQEAADR